MTYSVKEIYYTLQGEGANAGRPAVFLRFSGCNLWSGTEEGRAKGTGGCAQWCDTNFVGTDGPGGGKFKLATALAAAVKDRWPASEPAGTPLVVCTGGEPLLQLDVPLIAALHEAGFLVAVETNGTITPPPGIDWLTVSPKAGATLKIKSGQELKLVYPQQGMEPYRFAKMDFLHHYLQPLDNADASLNSRSAITYCLDNPLWRLSIQTHKVIGIP